MTNSTDIPNRLAKEKSPYLLQHRSNPVDWYPWGVEAFQQASERDVPVLLSIGYSTCHWCHVMNHESFEDPEVADIINQSFVAVKVDREERPDIDNLYMDACTAMNGHGGWPLTVLLNADKSPFFTGTYFPKNALINILSNTGEMWHDNRDRLLQAGSEVMAAISAPAAGLGTERHKLLDQVLKALRGAYDKKYGGFLPEPKFPSLQRILYLLRINCVDSSTGAGDMAFGSLLGMARGGIFDHVDGGFFRYSTDERWHIPHYEKMLYDNAMAIIAYAEGAAALGEKDFMRVAEMCAEFVLTELRAPEGGFYTALDADSPGGEGAYYLWTKSQVLDALGQEDGDGFAQDYSIDESPSVPNRIGRTIFAENSKSSLTKLVQIRATRLAPDRDEKILASGNALVTAALAISGRLLGRQDWIEEAEKTADFILDHLCLEGRLKASYYHGEVSQKGTLDDYAYFVWSLIELYQATFRPKWLGLALSWNAHMLELFGGAGGLFLSGRDVTDIPARQKVYVDGPLPSGNAVAASNLIRLYAITKDETYEKAAEDILRAGSGSMERYPSACTGLLSAILLSENAATLTISAGRGQDDLIKCAGGYRPFLVTVAGISDKPDTIEHMAPSARDARPVDGGSAAYLCDRHGCRKPVTQSSELTELL